MNEPRTIRSARSARARGFTVVELLVAVAIIIVLLSVLIVAVNAAVRQGQKANTSALMNALKQGLIQFESEVGYFPPVLNVDGTLMGTGANDPPHPDPISVTPRQYRDIMRPGDYSSITSLAEYLVGWRNAQGPAQLGDGLDGSGIRHPGADGVWNQTTSAGGVRQPDSGGKALGPYLELRDERLLASVDVNGNLHFPGDPGYDPDRPRAIADYWGNAIQYFRLPYGSIYAIDSAYRQPVVHCGGQRDDPAVVPTLSHVVRLRPYQLNEGEAVDVCNYFGDNQMPGDTTTSLRLQTAEFALFSPGPDKAFSPLFRIDDQEFNRDNIVEVGP